MTTETTAHFQKEIVAGLTADRSALELRLHDLGVPIPVTERVELLQGLGNTDAALVLIAEQTGTVLTASSLAATSSRALPGHRRWRVPRFSASRNHAADEQLLRWIADYGRDDFRCLSLTIELFERDAHRRARLAAVLDGLGFTRVKHQRSYQTTLELDLSPSADELLKNLDRDTRRDIRAPAKHSMELRPVLDVAFANRLESMVAHTFTRTGSHSPRFPWARIVEVSARHPSLSRISGVFDLAKTGEESLVSFAWGVTRNGYSTYEAGASIRRKDLRSLPLGYAPVWDLVMWAKEGSSTWFDFGGVTPGRRATPNDPVGGISAFKRSFCDNVVEVGEEWILHPNPVRGSLANFFAAAARAWTPKNRGTP